MLYKGPPPEGAFDVDKDFYEGQMVTFVELASLRSSVLGTTVEDVEDEDH